MFAVAEDVQQSRPKQAEERRSLKDTSDQTINEIVLFLAPTLAVA